MLTARDFFRLCAGILRRPNLWVVAIRQGLRLAKRGWWKKYPFLPLPGSGYMAFRATTQYGSATATPVIADVIDYLQWCKDWHSTNRPAPKTRRPA